MSLLRKQVTFFMAFLALMMVQAYGAEEGYASHHGISLIAWNSAGVFGEPGEGAGQAGDEEGPETHAPITVDMETRQLDGASAAHLEFCPVQLAEIFVHDWIWQQHLVNASARNPARYDALRTVCPPAAVNVARCVVMLI